MKGSSEGGSTDIVKATTPQFTPPCDKEIWYVPIETIVIFGRLSFWFQFMKAAGDVYAGGDIVSFPYCYDGDKMINIGHWQLSGYHGKSYHFQYPVSIATIISGLWGLFTARML